MRFVTFWQEQRCRLGCLVNGDRVVDLGQDASLPADMQDLIASGPEVLQWVEHLVTSGARAVPLSSVKLAAPFPRPNRNIICVGKNYYEHAREFGSSGFDSSSEKDVPAKPIFFTKAPNTVIGPGDPIPSKNDPTASVDYEGELTVVIGKRGNKISKSEAFDHVFGYTIINDVTSRTLQKEHNQWFLAKSIDGFCPMGPAVVTRDEIPGIAESRLQTRVNGELRQDAVVSQLIFDIPCLIAALSRTMTLEPGQLIATGTCAGVGIGFRPPKFLKPGDIVEIIIDGVGSLSNPVT